MPQQILKDLLEARNTIDSFATLMMGGRTDGEKVATELKRKILQRSRALSLKRRFAEADDRLNEESYGLFFTCLIFTVMAPELWKRVRLLFDKERILLLEEIAQDVKRTDANLKAIRRGWNEIYNLREEAEERMDDDIFANAHIEEEPPIESGELDDIASNDEAAAEEFRRLAAG